MTALAVALVVMVALLGVLVAGLLRSHAEILRALHELGLREDGTFSADRDHLPPTRPGVPQPRPSSTPGTDVTGVKPDGSPRQIAVVGVEHTTLLAFMSTGCSTCGTFWAELGRRRNLELPGHDTRLVIVTKGPEAESISRLTDLAPAQWPLVMSTSAWDRYEVPVSPYFIMVDGPSGSVVGEGSGTSWRQVQSLLTQALGDAKLYETPGRNSPRDATAREESADAELRAAGIEPGDASLYPTAPPEAP